MKRFIVLLVAGLLAAWQAFGQTAQDPNEGSRLAKDSSGPGYTFSWWGRAGMRYFILQSDDLFTWQYLPGVIETGHDDIIAWEITSSLDRCFVRLEIQVDPFATDSDGDGQSDGDEILSGGGGQAGGSSGTDPRLKDNPILQLSGFGFAAP